MLSAPVILSAASRRENGDEDRYRIRANTFESGINQPSVVGIFPHGAAACGAEDMAGNVWEWCSTPYLSYPLGDEVAAESLHKRTKDANYVLRGGSWYYDRDNARCAYRIPNPPAHDRGNWGVRLARTFSLS